MTKKLVSFTLIAALLTALLCIVCGCGKVIARDENSFYLTYKDGYKIMQLADIQVGSVAACNDAFDEIDKMVAKENPDLIVLTGDNIDYYSERGTFETLVNRMEKYNIYWAPVFGNHDDEQDESLVLTKDYMARAFENAEHCLFNRGSKDITGVGNYVINLINDKQTEIVYSLILMDSNTYRTYGDVNGWDYIYPD